MRPPKPEAGKRRGLRLGIGPNRDLRGLGINIEAGLPGAGENLHGQPATVRFEASPALATSLTALAWQHWDRRSGVGDMGSVNLTALSP